MVNELDKALRAVKAATNALSIREIERLLIHDDPKVRAAIRIVIESSGMLEAVERVLATALAEAEIQEYRDAKDAA